jgi:outer membrane protein assembly factor BamB
MRSALKNSFWTLCAALTVLTSSLVVLPLSGCGSGSRPGGSGAASRQKIGALTFRVTWPEPSRLIPRAANSIQLRLFKGTTEIAAPVVIEKPTQFTTGQPLVSVVNAFQNLEVAPTATTFRVEARAFPNNGASGVVQAMGANTVALTIAAPAATVGVTMDSTVARVDVQPSSGPSLRIGATRTFTATCFDGAGNVVLVDPATILWSTSNSAAGTLDPSGATALFTATGVGLSTQIRATYTEPDPDVASSPVTVDVASKGLATNSWAKFRGDIHNTGQASGSVTGDPAGSPLWEYITGASLVFASPVAGPYNPITNSWDVYVGSYDSTFYCLDGKTGAERWTFLTGGPIESTPALSKDNTVYIGSGDGKLYALDADTGTLLWEFQADGAIFGGPTLSSDGGVYFGTGAGTPGAGGTLYKLDAESGAEVWSRNIGTEIETSPALSRDEATLYVGGRNGQVSGIVAATGANVPGWPVPTGATIFVSSPAVDGAGNVYIGSFDGKLYSIAPSGSINWSFSTGSPIVASPALVSSTGGVATRVYVVNYDNNTGNRDSRLFALSGAGEELWRYPADNSGETIDLISSSPAIGRNGNVYFGSNNHSVYAVSSTGSLVWQLDAGDIVESSPSFGPDGTLYFGSWNGRVIAVR